MSDKQYKTPPIVWLRVTDYMHGWLEHELGCGARVKEQRVVCLQGLPGVKEVMKMETDNDVASPGKVVNTMSSTRHNCIMAGMEIDEQVMKQEYDVTRNTMELFIPIECPKMCMTKLGVLRPWTLDICLGREQATALQRLLRQVFWDAVAEYDREYARKAGGRKYPAVDMIEAFCADTRTPEIHVYAMRREWQRRVKRKKEKESKRQ